MRNGSNLQQIAKEQCRCKLKYCAACEIQAVGHYQEVKLSPASLNFCVFLAPVPLCASWVRWICVSSIEAQCTPHRLSAA